MTKQHDGPVPPHSTRPKVVYIMGAGRSGSTILGVALGNCEGVFCGGELDAWLRRSGIPNFADSARTRFWSAVLEHVEEGPELFGDRAWRYLEHSLSPLLAWRWRARRRLSQQYRRITEDLYRVITRVSGTTCIVDTSHYPLRAHELQRLRGIDLYLIYLVRDAQSVVSSFGRHDIAQPSKSAIATNAYLFLTHLLSVLVFLRHRPDRRLFLRYEDFIEDPERVLPEILKHVDAPTALPDLSCLTTGVVFQGNRILRSPTIGLRTRTTSEAPQRVSYITSVLQRLWQHVFSRLRPIIATVPSCGEQMDHRSS